MKPVIGIDLGTTNCALAYARDEAVEQFAIPQLVHEGEVRAESLRNLVCVSEAAARSSRFWLAQKKGLENAGRLVASAKSWLSQSRGWILGGRDLAAGCAGAS